jgi:class 3 adenylate cyclase
MIYFEKEDHSSAGTYLELSLNIARELNLRADIARVLSNLGYNEGRLGNYERAVELLDESSRISEDLNILRQLQVNYRRLSEITEEMGDSRLALDFFRKSSEIKDSLFTREMHEQIADFEVMYETERKQREIELLKQREIISNLERRRDRVIRNSLIAGLLLIFSLAGVIYWSLRRRVRDNRIIAYEKGKSDRLLTNILPSKIAADLKETGTTIPESFSNVTVFFSDLVNFTQLSAGLEPEFIINELNQIFTRFDSIIEKHGCERIKTIGDAYMAVCGVPEPDPGSAEKILEAAIEIIQYMEERRKKSPVKWEVRVGVHTGDVVAGVVGVKKYIYDVFGDTVNMASRMESNSLPMKINVSEATYELAREKFEFTEREPLEVKGKGKIRMYFLKTQR